MGPIDTARHWVLIAAAPHFWVISSVVILLALVLLVLSFMYLYRLRIVEDTPTSRIRSAAQGYVELAGRCALMDGLPIVAPLSSIPCTWYRHKVEKLDDKHDQVVTSGISDNLFLLEDDTGRCVIDPEGAKVISSTKEVWYENQYPSRRGKVLNAGMLKGLGARYRYTEERIHPGEPLYAIGLFVSVGGGDESFNTREEVALLLKEWKCDHSALLQRFDANKDGEIDLQEWEQVRKAAYRQVRREYAERSEKSLTHLMTRPKHSRRPYILSVRPEQELVNHYRLTAATYLAGFLFLGAIATWMVTLRLNHITGFS